jgi:hypothetical protein
MKYLNPENSDSQANEDFHRRIDAAEAECRFGFIIHIARLLLFGSLAIPMASTVKGQITRSRPRAHFAVSPRCPFALRLLSFRPPDGSVRNERCHLRPRSVHNRHRARRR